MGYRVTCGICPENDDIHGNMKDAIEVAARLSWCQRRPALLSSDDGRALRWRGRAVFAALTPHPCPFAEAGCRYQPGIGIGI
jgi:hypothetical protein